MKNDVIQLVTILKTKDKDGFNKVEQTILFECMADVKSATGAEFYKAMHEGMKVTLVASIYVDDYDAAVEEATEKNKKEKIAPQKVIFDNTEYAIVRTYKVGKRNMELSLQEVG